VYSRPFVACTTRYFTAMYYTIHLLLHPLVPFFSQGATATMEAWTRKEKPNLSWSHPWATAPATAIVKGVMGIVQTAPAFKTFLVRTDYHC
jgi:hypothetical protein